MQWWISFSEVIRNFGIVFGGAIGVYLGWKRVNAANQQAEAQLRQAALARRDHVAELFNRALGQLQDQKLEVRLGAIYTMGQVCRDFEDLAGPVLQTLTAFLREPRDYGDQEPPIDIREIMRILRDNLEV